jgi:hypothetical protein
MISRNNAISKLVDLSKTVKLIIYGPDCFLNRFLEIAANTHNFTYTLHAATQQFTNAAELLQIPSWNLDHNVIETRLEAGTSDPGY